MKSKIIVGLLVLLIGLNASSADRLPIKLINQIQEITKNAYTYYPASRYFRGTDVIIQFESDSRIGVAWYEGCEKSWVYNYMRFDSMGNILFDLRNLEKKRDYLEKFGIDWELGIPGFDYVVDENGNSWIIYSYLDKEKGSRWRIGWVKINNDGEIEEDKISDKRVQRRFITCPSEEFGFHLFFTPEGLIYLNSQSLEPISLKDAYKKPFPRSPKTCIEINGNNLLLVGYNPYSKHIHCQRISSEGKLLSLDTLNIEKVSRIIWDDVILPPFQEMYCCDSLIYFIYSAGDIYGQPKFGKLFMIVFDKNGKVITPKEQLKGQTLSVDQTPKEAKRFIKLYKNIIYYFGLDNQNNLYSWNSRLGYRTQIFAPFYSIHYDHVMDEIYNPKTEDYFYPDSLTWPTGWPKGGKLKYDMKLLINCDKPDRTYEAGEIIGIRCGVIHARLLEEETFLAPAYYSPNKCGWPPEITIYIDAPEDAAKEKAHLRYLGDDAISMDRPKVNLIKIPPGKVFNPSPDKYYYNKWSGIFKFETPGIYRMWCSYKFDSLTSSIKVDKIDNLYSDTIEIIIKE